MAQLRGIDVGGSANLVFKVNSRIAEQVGFVIVKATEGLTFDWQSFNRIVKEASSAGLPFGFYHYARKNDPIEEARHFIGVVNQYVGYGIPVLDWEEGQTVDWVNKFLGYFYAQTQVYPWVYGNAWRFDQGKVNPECDRWIARYPKRITDLQADLSSYSNKVDGLLCAWQFSESIQLNGYDGRVDGNVFYGDENQWRLYAEGDRTVTPPQSGFIVEDDKYKVTVEPK